MTTTTDAHTYEEAQEVVRRLAQQESYLMYEILKLGRRKDLGSAMLVIQEAVKMRDLANEIIGVMQIAIAHETRKP